MLGEGQAAENWRDRLRAFHAPTPIVIDRIGWERYRQAPAVRFLSRRISHETAGRLSEFLDACNVPFESFVEAIWATLLGRYSLEDDVLFGMIDRWDDAQGFLIRPRRIRLIRLAPFENWLLDVAASGQCDKSLESLRVDKLHRLSEVPSGVPLHFSVLSMNTCNRDHRERIGYSITQGDMALALMVDPSEPAEWTIGFDSSRFEDAPIERLLGHLETLQTSAIADPGEAVGKVQMLTNGELQQILHDWNETDTPFPNDKCLHELFEACADVMPDATAVICGDHSLTYLELDEQANQLANRLLRMGVTPDTLVGVHVERSLEMVVAVLATSKAGGAYVPIDPSYPEDRVRFMLDDSQVPVLLTQERLAERLGVLNAHVIRLDSERRSISAESVERPQSGVGVDHLAYVIYTSGSTGRPKGAMVNHQGRVNNFTDFNRRFDIGPADVAIGLSSLSFDMSAYDIFGTLACGATLVMVEGEERLNPAAWARLVHQHGVTVWHSVPALLDMLVDHVADRGEQQLSTLRVVLLGGDWIPTSLPNRLRSLAPAVRFVSMGGATEVSMDSTIFEVIEPDPDWRSIPYGVPMANQRSYILDRMLQPLPVGVPGELHLGGIGVGRGYLNRPELTAERFIPNPFVAGERIYKTGDLVRFYPDGNTEIVGRMDFQVKIRGFRVELGEIESSLREHPAVLEAVVMAKGRPGTEKRLIAYVIPDPDSSDRGHLSREDIVDGWRQVYDAGYAAGSDGVNDPELDHSTWISSFDHRDFPEAHVREWADATAARILRRAPKRVLELACGTGMILWRLAPGCERYDACDISEQALTAIRRRLEEHPLPQVRLSRREAIDFCGFEADAFDCVILNSVVRDFPSIDYLLEVLKGAARVVRPGGTIFVGDVPDFGLSELFHKAVALSQAEDRLPAGAVLSQAELKARLHDRLDVDPRFWGRLQRVIPRIGGAEVQLKRGRLDNEMTQFRYDVTLTVGERAKAPAVDALAWGDDVSSLHQLQELLSAPRGNAIAVTGIPNSRLSGYVGWMERLTALPPEATVSEVRDDGTKRDAGVHPDDLRALAETSGLAVIASRSARGPVGTMDAIFLAESDRGAIDIYSIADNDCSTTLTSLASDPGAAHRLRRIGPELRSFLSVRVPDYMIPSAFVVLDSFPLNPNGKINRGALPEPDTDRPALLEEFVAARSELERAIATIWSQHIGIQKIGVNDHFLDLGGSSLIAARIVNDMRDVFEVEYPLAGFMEENVADCALRLQALGGAAGLDVEALASVFNEVAAMPSSLIDGSSEGGSES